MENPTATAFIQAFNPMEMTHVLWLRKMNREMDQVDLSRRMDIDSLVNSNPMGKKMTNALDWVFIHFALAMAYTKAVLENKAWVPEK
jgi:hypothetical protein